MTKQDLLEIANYSNWADEIVINWLDQITDEQWEKEIESSFNSIAKTAIHIVSGKKVWVDFWQNTPELVFLSAIFDGSKSDLITIWKNTMDHYKNVIENYEEDECSKIISFKVRGEEWEMEFAQTVMHHNNHATYHRGQLITMLRQAGFTNLRNTDMATYYAKVKK